MKDEISTNVQLYLGNVELNVTVTDKLKLEEGNLRNFGHICVSDGRKDEETDCFWDNINYFYNVSRKEFKKECGKELEKSGFDIEETRKSIKKLLKRALKLNILEKSENL